MTDAQTIYVPDDADSIVILRPNGEFAGAWDSAERPDCLAVPHGYSAWFVIEGEKKHILTPIGDVVVQLQWNPDPPVVKTVQADYSDESPIMQYFEYSHLREGLLRNTSMKFHDLAYEMDRSVPSGPEKSAGLRKLLEAKDCFVRAALN